MKKFAAKLLLLLLPITALYGFPLLVLLVSKELVSVPRVVNLQSSTPTLVLYGTAYSNRTMWFKRNAVLARAPSVIALGTSRVLQFRSKFFKDSGTFFNAGMGVEQMWDFASFLEHIPQGKEPKLILLGLDQWLFNANWASGATTELIDDSNRLDTVLHKNWTIYQDYAAGKFSLARLITFGDQNYGRIGLTAIVNKDGFRNDGSYYYGKYIANPLSPENEDFQYKKTLQMIANGEAWFVYGDHVFANSLTELERFLRLTQEKNIHVVGFLPPYAHQIYTKLMAMPDQYHYMTEIVSAVAPLFKKYGYSFRDFSDVASLGCTDSETIDGFHASEKAYLRLFLSLIEQDPQLSMVAANGEYLRKRLAEAESSYVVFGNDEY